MPPEITLFKHAFQKVILGSQGNAVPLLELINHDTTSTAPKAWDRVSDASPIRLSPDQPRPANILHPVKDILPMEPMASVFSSALNEPHPANKSQAISVPLIAYMLASLLTRFLVVLMKAPELTPFLFVYIISRLVGGVSAAPVNYAAAKIFGNDTIKVGYTCDPNYVSCPSQEEFATGVQSCEGNITATSGVPYNHPICEGDDPCAGSTEVPPCPSNFATGSGPIGNVTDFWSCLNASVPNLNLCYMYDDSSSNWMYWTAGGTAAFVLLAGAIYLLVMKTMNYDSEAQPLLSPDEHPGAPAVNTPSRTA